MDKITLQSLASDLKRIALSIQRDSPKNAERFQEEALKWLQESKNGSSRNNDSIKKILAKVEGCLARTNNLKKAEDLLMYCTLIQNRAKVLSDNNWQRLKDLHIFLLIWSDLLNCRSLSFLVCHLCNICVRLLFWRNGGSFMFVCHVGSNCPNTHNFLDTHNCFLTILRNNCNSVTACTFRWISY